MSRGTGDAMVRLSGVEVRYDDQVAVAGADLEVARGDLLALLGASGCGKTSLLRAIAGFERPSAGQVEIDGVPVAGPRVWVRPEKRQVGMVFQHGALFPHLTVAANVAYGVKKRRDADERVRDALARVGLAELGHRYPDELSGGQQQRVALARALAPQPKVVLLDEPFANLDATLRGSVRDQVREVLEGAGITAILVTHDQEEALSFADRVAVMALGRILQVASPEQLYHHPANPAVAHFLGEGDLVPCTVTAGRLYCAYGTAVTQAEDGGGKVFIRPEDLTLHHTLCPPSAEKPHGLTGKVVGQRFFGHDLLTVVQLADGTQVHVRQLSSACTLPGTPVEVQLRPKHYPVFPG